jgi:hypothetical protein
MMAKNERGGLQSIAIIKAVAVGGGSWQGKNREAVKDEWQWQWQWQ